MLSFSLVAEALTGLIYHRPSGENSNFQRCQHDFSILKFVKQGLIGIVRCFYARICQARIFIIIDSCGLMWLVWYMKQTTLTPPEHLMVSSAGLIWHNYVHQSLRYTELTSVVLLLFAGSVLPPISLPTFFFPSPKFVFLVFIDLLFFVVLFFALFWKLLTCSFVEYEIFFPYFTCRVDSFRYICYFVWPIGSSHVFLDFIKHMCIICLVQDYVEFLRINRKESTKYQAEIWLVNEIC